MISGKATPEQCAEQWEKIVEQHNYHSGNLDYQNLKTQQLAYLLLLNKFRGIRAAILSLYLAIDNDRIEYLAKEGYKINTRSGQVAFEQSLNAALIKSNNLNSKLKQKLNQIQTFNDTLITKRHEYNERATGFEEMAASISFHLGFAIDESITLARYNEYVKIINKQQHGARTERHNNR